VAGVATNVAGLVASSELLSRVLGAVTLEVAGVTTNVAGTRLLLLGLRLENVLLLRVGHSKIAMLLLDEAQIGLQDRMALSVRAEHSNDRSQERSIHFVGIA
jgi:hypothetical protein